MPRRWPAAATLAFFPAAGLMLGGGTPLLGTEGGRVGPGGQSVSEDALAFHYYAEELDGAFRLGLAGLDCKDGWPAARWN